MPPETFRPGQGSISGRWRQDRREFALDALSAAATKATDVVKASCPSAIPLTPAARLDAAQARLEAMVQAVNIVQGPLEKFYNSLTDEQKHRFDAADTGIVDQPDRRSFPPPWTSKTITTRASS